MNKNTEAKQVKSKQVKAKRGRPSKPATLPANVRKGSKVTVSEIFAANSEGDAKVAIQCRLTVYKRIREFVKLGMLRKTKETRPTGGVGKPATVYEVLAVSPEAAKRSKVAKSKAKAPKLADTPPVNMTPAEPAPVAETAPATVAEPVAA